MRKLIRWLLKNELDKIEANRSIIVKHRREFLKFKFEQENPFFYDIGERVYTKKKVYLIIDRFVNIEVVYDVFFENCYDVFDGDKKIIMSEEDILKLVKNED